MHSTSDGFYSYPSLSNEQIVFSSEDDLWTVDVGGGLAQRITNGKGTASHASFSPCGKKIAFTGMEEGTYEVFVLDLTSGKHRKLTHLGASTFVVGWSDDGKFILFRSNHQQSIQRSSTLFKVAEKGGEPIDLGYGESSWFGESPSKNLKVIGRFSDDIARWKRYKGGTAGVIWVKDGRKKWVRILEKIKSGVVRPMVILSRVYFISDMKGYGELYSCLKDGSEIRKHTNHRGFYVRQASTDGKKIVYTCGGDVYLFDPEKNKTKKVDIDYRSPRSQMVRKYPNPRRYLSSVAMHPKGIALASISRGKLFAFSNWEGGEKNIGQKLKGRMRNVAFLNDGKRILVQNDESGEELFYIFDTVKNTHKALAGKNYGRILSLEISPTHDVAVATNHRYELITINLKSGTMKTLDHSDYDRITGINWSADGQYVVYAKPDSDRTSKIRVVFVSLPNSNNWELMVRGHRGRIFPRGNSYQDDPGARCAPLQFCSAEERKVFRLVVWAPENILCSSF